MHKDTAIKLFEEQKVRVEWNDAEEKWYFSIVDVVAILTDNPYQQARNYWKVLKHRLSQEGNESVTNCNQLKMKATDGKMYLTDVADTEQLLRLIQSIPSPKAEPFKMWLAKVGRERIDEIEDPEIAINRALETYLKKGYSLNWVNQRLKSIEIRKGLTDEWDRGGIQKGLEYAILTDELTKAWSGMTTKEYKKLKDLKKENLRDNMTNLELVLNMLAEVSATEISKAQNPKGLSQNAKVARAGGEVAKKARKELENKTGKKVITNKNAKQSLNQIEDFTD
ncbi:MAG: Bro-N domain-containing protein [Alphaproteobacteria bacterium]|nr:Bro-N domain-containing protein [Alphaproteobacteria bacterium]